MILMNKIIVIDDNVDSKVLSESIQIELIPKNALFEVNTLKINILKDEIINIDYRHISESKLNIEVNVLDGVTCYMNEFREGVKSKIKYHFNISCNSILNVRKFYDIDTIKESISIIESSGIDYEFRTTVVKELHSKQNFEERQCPIAYTG